MQGYRGESAWPAAHAHQPPPERQPMTPALASCEVCSHHPLSSLFMKDGSQYEECPQCGLIRIHPQPADETLENIYQNDYFAAWGKSEGDFRVLKRKTFTSILDMLPQEKRSGKLLDVGAASGILMGLAQEWGFQSYGVEASRDGAAAIAEKFGTDRAFSDQGQD